jgi:hypothetical protein
MFRFEPYDSTKYHDIQIFKSRLAREIKGKATNAPYEKSRLVIQGIMPDSGAAEVSTAGEPQATTLQQLDTTIKLDTSTAEQQTIRFGKGTATSLGTIDVPTPIGVIIFHVVPANTPFLLCLQDMDRMRVKLDNLQNVLIQDKKMIPVVRKWGHPWMLLHHPEQSITWSHLTDMSAKNAWDTLRLCWIDVYQEPPDGTVMKVIKPLYGIAEAGTHWWATYSKHHKEKLMMTTSTYDPCFLISTTKDKFGVVGMQTDDTIILADDRFASLEDDELTKANLLAKPKEKLTPESPLVFNGCVLTHTGTTVSLRQKEQGKKIQLIDINAADFKQKYIEQRARGAYIASICQPEAAFDLSVAAQHQEPTKDDVAILNKRLQWQLDHLDRGLTYVPLDMSTAKLFVFVDGSFANNKDFSSQIGFLIIIANETAHNDEFTINGNLVHWSSTKSKRVTRSVLASEIYGMVGGVDMSYAIGSTISMIMEQLELPNMPTIVCTDSYSLYECLVKLGTTKEKRLMIDIMALRQSYERRELFEIRWINGQDNPADAMTKTNPNKTLETLVDTNSLRVRVEGWVKRDL